MHFLFAIFLVYACIADEIPDTCGCSCNAEGSEERNRRWESAMDKWEEALERWKAKKLSK